MDEADFLIISIPPPIVHVCQRGQLAATWDMQNRSWILQLAGANAKVFMLDQRSYLYQLSQKPDAEKTLQAAFYQQQCAARSSRDLVVLEGEPGLSTCRSHAKVLHGSKVVQDGGETLPQVENFKYLGKTEWRMVQCRQWLSGGGPQLWS